MSYKNDCACACACARCAKYDDCPNAGEQAPGYEGICADCRENRYHAGHDGRATLRLMGDVLRVELRCGDRNRCATTEIEVTKIWQGHACMSFPDGATLARRRSTAGTRDEVATLLREMKWSVRDESTP